MRIGVGQMDLKCCEIVYNIEQTKTILEDASANSVDVLVLPEMANSGYYFESIEEARGTSEVVPDGPFSKLLLEWSKKGCLVLAGVNERADEILYNSAVVFAAGKHLGTYWKTRLYGSEKKFFKSGSRDVFLVEHDGYCYSAIICFEWNFPGLTSQ